MNVSVIQDKVSNIKADAVIIPYFSDEKESTLNNLRELFPSVSVQLDVHAPTGKSSEVTSLIASEGVCKRFVLLGLGEKAKVTPESLRRAAGTAARSARGKNVVSLAIIVHNEQHLAPIVEGAYLALYDYTDYRGKSLEERRSKESVIENICVAIGTEISPEAAQTIVTEVQNYCASVNLARNVANAPNCDMYPEKLAEVAEKEGKKAGFKVKVWDKKKITSEEMVGLLAVNAGSERPPVFIVMEYKGGKKDEAPIVFVGKGVTFDTGGISIKPSAGMAAMKLDMHGAATVLGTMSAIAKNKLPVNAIGLIPATENMPSGTAYLPGDVLRYTNGVTVEIDNTDAEGRLILADGLIQAMKLKPKAVIDVATLTGACVVALGSHSTGLMSNNSDVTSKLQNAATATGEHVTELPLLDDYKETLKSDIADMKNSGGREAGAITAGLFLASFVEKDVPWAHLDIAGTGMLSKPGPYSPAGGSGVGVRLLYTFAKNS